MIQFRQPVERLHALQVDVPKPHPNRLHLRLVQEVEILPVKAEMRTAKKAFQATFIVAIYASIHAAALYPDRMRLVESLVGIRLIKAIWFALDAHTWSG